jgi:hypothetical protein
MADYSCFSFTSQEISKPVIVQTQPSMTHHRKSILETATTLLSLSFVYNNATLSVPFLSFTAMFPGATLTTHTRAVRLMCLHTGGCSAEQHTLRLQREQTT